MPEKKSKFILDDEIIKVLDKIIDEIGDTTKSVFRQIADMFVKKGSETLSGILDENKTILKDKIKSKGKESEKDVKEESK